MATCWRNYVWFLASLLWDGILVMQEFSVIIVMILDPNKMSKCSATVKVAVPSDFWGVKITTSKWINAIQEYHIKKCGVLIFDPPIKCLITPFSVLQKVQINPHVYFLAPIIKMWLSEVNERARRRPDQNRIWAQTVTTLLNFFNHCIENTKIYKNFFPL